MVPSLGSFLMISEMLSRCTRHRVIAGLFIAFGCVAMAMAATSVDEQGSELYYSANGLYNRKLYDLAVEEYTRFLAEHPNHPKKTQAGLGLGLSYYALEKHKDAAPLLEKAGANESLPNRFHVKLLHGQCMLALGRTAEAETEFAAVVASGAPKDIKRDAAIGLVDALYQQEKWQAVVSAGDALSSTADIGPRAVRARFQGAAARYHLNDYAGASKILAGLGQLGDNPELAHQVAFLLGECSRQTGDLAGAAQHFSVAVEKHPGPLSADAMFRLGYVLFSQDKFAEAAASLSAFLTAHSEHDSADQAKLFRGQALLELKQYDEAVQELAPLVKSQPPDPDATLWLARAYSRRGRFADAYGATRGAISRMPTNTPPAKELVFDLGNNLMSDGKYGEAVKAFNTIVSGHPDWNQTADALRLRAACLHKADKFKESLADCEAFLAKYRSNSSIDELAFLKAENQYFLGMHEAALGAYTQFLSNYPQSANRDATRLRIAQLHYRKKAWQEVLKQTQELTGRNRDDAFFKQVAFLAGDSHYNLEQWDEAVLHLGGFVDQQPQEPNVDTALLKLALARLNKGERDAAIELLTELVTAHKSSRHLPLALAELGRLQYETDRPGNARGFLESIVKNHADSAERPKAEYYLGWVSLAEAKDDEAAAHFEQVIDRAPEHPLLADSLLQKGLLLVKRSAYPEAQEVLDRFLKEFSENPKAEYGAYYLGMSYARAENWQQAIPHFKTVADNGAASPLADRAVYELAWCERSLNRPAEAMKQYETLLAAFPKSDLVDRATFELSELESEGNKLNPAIRRLDTLLSRTKDSELREQILYRLGWSYQAKGQPDKALELLRQLIEEYPKSGLLALAHYHAGEAALKKSEYTLARKHFAPAIADANLPPEFRESALVRLAETQALTSQWPESEASFSIFVASHADSKLLRRAHLGQGWARENQSKFNEAIKAYRLVIDPGKRDETAARAQFQIGECHFALKQYDNAIRELLKVEINYAHPQWVSKSMLEMGRALEAKGEKIRAIEQFELLAEKYPQSDAAAVARKRVDELSI
jgi:TolA-binding protein